MESVFVPSFLDGFRVVPSVFENEPAKTIYDEFRHQMEITRNSRKELPLITEPSGRQLSYINLDNMVQRLVSALRKNDIGEMSQQPVIVFLPPGCARIAALFALDSLKIAYVPIDPIQTEADRSFILGHSKPQAVILNNDRVPILKQLDLSGDVRLVVVDQDCVVEGQSGLQEGLQGGEGSKNSDDHVCLTLYTSASTGTLTGVMLTDTNLLNGQRWQWAEMPFKEDESEVCLIKANHLFLDSYIETLNAVLRLQRIVIVDPKAEPGNVAVLLAETIEKHKVTRLILVPSLLQTLLDLEQASKRLESLRLVITSGEALRAELARRFFRTISGQPRLANLFGTTETGYITAAIFVSEADVNARSANGFLPIGRPIHNTTIYAVREDKFLLVPYGVVGQIFVSGESVCKGFAGESKVMGRFVEKPHEMTNIGIGQRLLGLGDLVRIVPGGELFYCGRSDSLVKIRGNRFSTIQVQEALKAVLQMAIERNPPPSGKTPRYRVVAVEHQQYSTFRLAAFYEQWAEASQLLHPVNVRKELFNRLPDYAVPELLFPLEIGNFPVEPKSGEIDQRALKHVAEEACSKSAVDMETALADIKPNGGCLQSAMEAVRRVGAYTLGVEPEQVVMDATFFNQGGNSLSVVTAVAALNKVGYHNAAAEMFLTPGKTLLDVSRHLSETFQKGLIDSCKSAASTSSLPDWLEFRNVADLSESETRRAQTRYDYFSTVVEPLGRLLKFRPTDFSQRVSAIWKYYRESGPLSIVAIDRRKRGEDAIIGGLFCTDFTVEDDETDWKGVEAMMDILVAADKPVQDELLKHHSVKQLYPGLVLFGRMLFVEDDIGSDDAAVTFVALEKELIRRGRKLGFKTIISETTSLATEIIERDILGYKERFALYVREYQTADGKRPYADASKDFAVRVMVLDL